MLQSIETNIVSAELFIWLKLVLFISLFVGLFFIGASQRRIIEKQWKEQLTFSCSSSKDEIPKRITRKKLKPQSNNYHDNTTSPISVSLTIADALGFTDAESHYEMDQDVRTCDTRTCPKRLLTIGDALGTTMESGGRRNRKVGVRWVISVFKAASRISFPTCGIATTKDKLSIARSNDSRAGKPLISLMKESDCMDQSKIKRKRSLSAFGVSKKKKDKSSGNMNDGVCHFCYQRNKDAGLVPCGHAYCRICSREIWINTGSCPMCNTHIVEVLDAF